MKTKSNRGGARVGAGRKPSESTKMVRVPESIAPMIAQLIASYRANPESVLSTLPKFLSGDCIFDDVQPSPVPELFSDSLPVMTREEAHKFYFSTLPTEMYARFDRVMESTDCTDAVYFELCKRFFNDLLSSDSDDPVIYNVRMMRNWVRSQLDDLCS